MKYYILRMVAFRRFSIVAVGSSNVILILIFYFYRVFMIGVMQATSMSGTKLEKRYSPSFQEDPNRKQSASKRKRDDILRLVSIRIYASSVRKKKTKTIHTNSSSSIIISIYIDLYIGIICLHIQWTQTQTESECDVWIMLFDTVWKIK